MQTRNMPEKELGKNNLFGKADFEFYLENGFMIIHDLNLNSTSVTNDLNNVLASLVSYGHNLYELKVIYKDSMNIYDAVLMQKDNLMKGIASLNAKTLNEAFKFYDARISHQALNQHHSRNPC